MSLRGHYVVVDPSVWEGELHDLARRLVPIVGQPSSQIAKRLATGAVTIEADLTLQSAQSLQNKLTGLGVTAYIKNDEEAEETFGLEDFDFDLDAMFSEVENLPGDSSAVFSEEEVADPRQTQMGFAFSQEIVERREEAQPRTPVSPYAEQPASESKEISGWGDIFPDLKPTDSGSTTPKPQPKPSPTPDTPKPPVPKPVAPTKSNPAQVPKSEPDPIAKPDPIKPTPKPVPLSLDELEGASPKRVEPTIPQGPAVSAASFMEQIVGTDSEKRGPYAPTGFEDQYEHATSIAMMLAVVAPGAGHVYNGSDDKALGVAARSILIKPYFDSIQEAKLHAEKIRSYHRPRPEPGSFKRAMVHVFGLWLALAFVVTATVFVISKYVIVERPSEAREVITPVKIRSAYETARLQIVESRFAATTAVRTELEKEVRPTLSMTDDERVKRLYAVGVERCRENDFGACTSIMKRVVKLDPLYRSALKLQTWSSQQLTAKTPEPMPEVGEVPTLSELEKSELNDEVPDLP